MTPAMSAESVRILLIDGDPAIKEAFYQIFPGPCGNWTPAAAYSSARKPALLPSGSEQPDAASAFFLDSVSTVEAGLELVRQGLDSAKHYALAFVSATLIEESDWMKAATQLWELDADLHVIICTSSVGTAPDELGFTDRLLILKTPFDSAEVLQLAHTVSSKWRLMQRDRLKMQSLERLIEERTRELEKANAGLQAEIIERKQAERERQQWEVQLRQAQKLESIGQLAAGIAHEINTPTQYVGDNVRFVRDAFADIRNILEPLKPLLSQDRNAPIAPEQFAPIRVLAAEYDLDYLLDEVPKAVQQSLDGIGRVTKIVQAMKEFSHPGSTEKTAIDLNKAIETTVTVAHNEWKYVAEVKTDLEAGLPLVPCLPGELNQVLLNLIVNAAHAIGEVAANSEKRGVISIHTRSDGNWIEIRISDTGAGIPENIRERIFEPFFTTKPLGKGTGQGLAIAHSVIVEKHGGAISFESEVGRGTTFIVRLPLTATESRKRVA